MNDSELIAWCKEYAVEKRKEAECADYDHWRNSYIREADTFDAIAARLAQPTAESVVELARKRWPETQRILIDVEWNGEFVVWEAEILFGDKRGHWFTAPTLAELAKEIGP